MALAKDLDISIPEYAAEMFEAKSDVSSFSDIELLKMDSKIFDVDGTKLRGLGVGNHRAGCGAGAQRCVNGRNARFGRIGRCRASAFVRYRHP